MTSRRCRIEFAHSARDDLRDITERYSAQQVPDVGKRLAAEIIACVERLAIFPDSGRTVPEFETPWLREVQLPPFRIVYRRDEGFVTVVRVWRSERLMDPTLGKSATGGSGVPSSAPAAGSGQALTTATEQLTQSAQKNTQNHAKRFIGQPPQSVRSSPQTALHRSA